VENHSYIKSRLEEYGAILTLGDVAEILRVSLDTAKEIALRIGAWEEYEEGIMISSVDLERYIHKNLFI
jgi:hypothetical protein